MDKVWLMRPTNVFEAVLLGVTILTLIGCLATLFLPAEKATCTCPPVVRANSHS